MIKIVVLLWVYLYALATQSGADGADDPDPNDPEVCGADQDEVPDHEAHRHGKPPRVPVTRRLRDRLGRSLPGRRGLANACAVPGVSLTNYSLNAQQKGWGSPCAQARTTIALSNGVRITVASEIARLATLCLNDCLRRGYVIRPADTGAYNCRKIAGTNVWSNHAWALAIDINWQLNPYTSPLQTNIPAWMVQLMNRYGFAWGGHYIGKKDAMHFEFMGTPAQANAATALVERELAGGDGPLPVVRPGSRVVYLTDPHMLGTDIQKLQATLNRWYTSLEKLLEDGDFGRATDGRVRYFQERAGLTVDGEAGPATWKALGY